jgi:hypothetical protein
LSTESLSNEDHRLVTQKSEKIALNEDRLYSSSQVRLHETRHQGNYFTALTISHHILLISLDHGYAKPIEDRCIDYQPALSLKCDEEVFSGAEDKEPIIELPIIEPPRLMPVFEPYGMFLYGYCVFWSTRIPVCHHGVRYDEAS